MKSQYSRGNSKEAPMETDGTPGSYRKIAKVNPVKRPRICNDVEQTLSTGASSENDIVDDMQTDRQDGDVHADKTSVTKSSRCLHNELFAFLQANLVPAMSEYRSFLTNVSSYLEIFDLDETKEDIGLILKTLEDRNIIGVGSYNVLLNVLKDGKLVWLMRGLQSRIKPIHDVMVVEGQPILPENKVSPGEVMSSSRLHSLLREHIHEHLVPEMREFKSFLNNVKAYLPRGTVETNKQTVVDILDMLEVGGWIGRGNYDKLEGILGDSNLKALQTDVTEKGNIIRQAMEEEGIVVNIDIRLPEIQEKKSSDRQHADVIDHIGSHLDQHEYKSFTTIIRGVYLHQAEVETYAHAVELLEAMELKGVFSKGDYSNLIKILSDAHLNSLSVNVQKTQAGIRDTMLEEGLLLPELASGTANDNILDSMHNGLFEFVSRNLSPHMQEYKSFLTLARSYLSGAALEANKESVSSILVALQTDRQIIVGNYDVLIDILEHSSLGKLKAQVEEKQCEIQAIMKKHGRDIPKITRKVDREKKSSEQQHRDLFNHVDSQLDPKMSDYRSFLTAVKPYLPQGTLANNDGRVLDVLDKLQSENFIQKGNYHALLDILKNSNLLKLRSEIEKREERIRQSMKEEGVSIEPVKSKPLESERLHQQLLEKVHRKISPKMPQYRSFQTNMRTYLDKGALANNKKTAAELLTALEITNKLDVGKYEILLTVLRDSGLRNLEHEVRQDQVVIEAALKEETLNTH